MGNGVGEGRRNDNVNGKGDVTMSGLDDSLQSNIFLDLATNKVFAFNCPYYLVPGPIPEAFGPEEILNAAVFLAVFFVAEI